jgi:hypothetical protein
MKYAVEMCSGSMVYIRSFVNIGKGIHKLMGIHRHTDNVVTT